MQTSVMPIKSMKSISILAIKVFLICLFTLSSILCPLSCRMDDGAVEIIKNDYDPPVLQSVEVTGARTANITFSKPIIPVNAYSTESCGDTSLADCKVSGDVLTITTAYDLAIGEQYTLGGQVRDEGGNTLHYAVPVLGFNNNPAAVIIMSVHPKSEKDSKAGNYKDEFIQLYVTRAGNISGFSIRTGRLGDERLILPKAEVSKGEIVTVHLQTAEEGCIDEAAEDLSLAVSRYASKVRDVWVRAVDSSSGEVQWARNTKKTNCLGESDEAVLLMNGEEVLDAVLYATGEVDEWKGSAGYELASMAVEAGLWEREGCDGAVIIDKAFTAATILKRNIDATGGGEIGGDWYKTSFIKKIEQKVLTSLYAGDGNSGGGGDNTEGGNSGGGGGNGNSGGGGDDDYDEEGEIAGGKGGGGSAGGGGGNSGGSNSGKRPLLSLPPPKCLGNPPRVIISSVHPAYTSAIDSEAGKVFKEEFIQLFVLGGGNLSHLTVNTGKLGSSNYYPLPEAEVKAGDIVTVHLRRVGQGCNDEVGEELFLASSWYSCEKIRDVWIDNVYDPAVKKGAPALDRSEDSVAVFCGENKVMMDAVFYSVEGTAVFKSIDTADIVRRAVEAGLFTSDNPESGVTIDKAFTPAVIMQRNGCRGLLREAKKGNLPPVITVQQWSKKPFSKKVEQDLLTFVD